MEKPPSSTQPQYHIIIEKQPQPHAKSFLSVEYDTWSLIFSFVVPLISFILGIAAYVVTNKIKDKSDSKIAAQVFLFWIKKSINSSKSFLDQLEKNKEETKALDSFLIKRPVFINLHLSRLTADQEKIFKALVTYRKGEKKSNSDDYASLMINLEFLSDAQDMLFKNANVMIDDFNKMFQDWNDYILKFHRAKHILISKRAPSPRGTPLFAINNLFEAWYKEKVDGLNSTSEFLVALEPLLLELYAKEPADDVEFLFSLTGRIKKLYAQFLFEKKQYVELLDDFCEKLTKAIGDLESANRQIEMV